MKDFVYKERTRRNLPHLQPTDATLFVTFRLAGTIPRSVLQLYLARKKWLEEETRRIVKLRLESDSPEMRSHEERLLRFQRQWFVKFEEILHKAETGPCWLKDPVMAKIVADAMHYLDGKDYRLEAFSIMSNHVHVVFAPFLSGAELLEVLSPEGLRFISRNPPLDAIMKSLKGYTAWKANRALNRKGTFWQAESYDHVVRNPAEFTRVVKYVLDNSVKAGLVGHWRDWKWSYRRETVP